MVSVKQVYQTPDGETFDNSKEAEAHFDRAFQAWLDTWPKIDIRSLIEDADDSAQDERYCTDREVVRDVAERAYLMRCNNLARPSLENSNG